MEQKIMCTLGKEEWNGCALFSRCTRPNKECPVCVGLLKRNHEAKMKAIMKGTYSPYSM